MYPLRGFQKQQFLLNVQPLTVTTICASSPNNCLRNHVGPILIPPKKNSPISTATFSTSTLPTQSVASSLLLFPSSQPSPPPSQLLPERHALAQRLLPPSPLPPPLSIYPMLSIPRPENSLPLFLTIPNPPNTGRPPTVPARRPIDPSSSSIPLATTTSPYVSRALDPSRKANCRSTVTATPYSPVTVTIAVLAS